MFGDKSRNRRGSVVPAIGGLMLVLLGVALGIDQLGYFIPYRGVFLLLVLPAALAIIDSFRLASIVGWRSVQPLSRLVTGVIFALIGASVALGLDTGFILPALIVILGAATLMRAVLGRM